MPTIDDSIRRIDNVICRHLDNIENTSRGAISQDILEQLMKLVNHIMLKFYANGKDISINEENIAKAIEFAQVTSEIVITNSPKRTGTGGRDASKTTQPR